MIESMQTGFGRVLLWLFATSAALCSSDTFEAGARFGIVDAEAELVVDTRFCA